MPFTIVGQEYAVTALRNAVASGRVAHAYLFSGPRHTGKTLLALQFAQLLNCTGPDERERPCGRCRACDCIAAGAHPDLELVGIGGVCSEQGHDHKKDDSRDIRICQVRRLQELASRAPYEAVYRVFIIEPADALNPASIGALLKTLEEPPPRVVIILVAEREELLPDTIRSRARRIALRGIPKRQIEHTLRERWDAEPSRAAELATLAGGRLGWAVAALHDERMMERREAALAQAEELATASLAKRFAAASELGSTYSRDRQRVHDVLEQWERFWRDIMVVAAGREQSATHRDRLDRLRVLAAGCEPRAAVRGVRAVAEARQQLSENASPVLTLEAMMLRLPVLSDRRNAVAERLGE